MNQEYIFLDDRMIDNYVFNHLIELGYAPSLEETQDITDMFLILLDQCGLIVAMEEGEDGEERESWK